MEQGQKDGEVATLDMLAILFVFSKFLVLPKFVLVPQLVVFCIFFKGRVGIDLVQRITEGEKFRGSCWIVVCALRARLQLFKLDYRQLAPGMFQRQ